MLEILSVVVLAIAGVMFTVSPSNDDAVAASQQEKAKVEYMAQKTDNEQPRL